MCKKRLVYLIAILICCSFLMSTTSCKWLKKKKAVEQKPTEKAQTTDTKPVPPPAPSDTQQETTHPKIEPIASDILKKIYFDFDKSEIRNDQKPVLDENAKYLMEHADVKIILEGHCDERGTIEYNLGLGDRRANSVKKYLGEKGVKNEIQIISKGEEQPIDPGHDEAAWAKNRRVEFIIIK